MEADIRPKHWNIYIKRYGVLSQKTEIFLNTILRNLNLAQQAIGHIQNFEILIHYFR